MIDLRYTLLWLIACAVVAGLLYWITGLPFAIGFLIVAIALILNGLLAEWEDRRPGGFYNPHDKDKE